MSTPASSATRQIARAAGSTMAALVLSQAVGLARWVLVANVFGTQGELDAFNAANRVSETLFNLAAGGALGSAFIPTFAGLLARRQREGAWRLASAIANLILLVLVAASLVAAVFAPQIVRYLLASGFASDPAKEALTVQLLRIMLPSAALFGLSGLVMGILNSHQVFFIPTLTPSMYNLGLIVGAVLLAPRWGIQGLAIGVVLGSALHLALQIPSLLRLKGQYFPVLGLDLPSVREVARLMAPRLFGAAIVQLNFWVNNFLASFQPEGSLAGIGYGFMLMLIPQAAIAQSVAIAALPTFSAQVALGKLDEMRSSLAASLRGVLLLAAPATVGLILLRRPLVSALFERGSFTEHSTELVAWALLWYAAGLIGHSLVEILARAFYSLHDTKTPVLVGAAAMSLNVLFSFLFTALFARLGWAPHGGLALANSLATALEMVGLLWLMRRKLNGLEGWEVLSGLLAAAAASLAMALALWAWLQFTTPWPAWLVALGGIAVGGLVYALAMLVLRVREGRALVVMMGRRLPSIKKFRS